ncbi:MAG: DUF362 domain-containing protein [Bryobacteraceae bacterium]
MTRREFAALGLAPLARPAPVAPVALARCRSYGDDVAAALSTMFDQLGGLSRLVKGRTVTVKLNLTGSPGQRFQGKPVGVTHYVHPKVVGAAAHLMGRAGARRIRLVESAWATSGPLEEYLLDAGWNVRALSAAASGVEFENTNALGKGKRYSRLMPPGGGSIFPAYDLNHAYEDTDVFVSLAKLKEHGTCGVTLSLKNCFGNTPASIYGDDAGRDEPNENPAKGRVEVMHLGRRGPSRSAPQERDPASSREPGYRVPRVTVDLVAARPVDLAIIDGIESVSGGEGPWIEGLRLVQPGLLIAGLNPVCTDAVGTAAIGFNPRAPRGTAPFRNCDNTLLLAEAAGIGSAELALIPTRGLKLPI